jgi:hypothetical protein
MKGGRRSSRKWQEGTGILTDCTRAPMRRIDELFITWPFLGSRRMTTMLRAQDYTVNRKRIQRRIQAVLGPKPRVTAAT